MADSSARLEPEAIRAWLASDGGFYSDDAVVSVLTRCRSLTEVRFAAGLLSVGGWYVKDADTFGHPRYLLRPQFRFAGRVVSFVLNSRWTKKAAIVDVVRDAHDSARSPFATTVRERGMLFIPVDELNCVETARELHASLEKEFQLDYRRDPETAYAVPALVKRVLQREFDWKQLAITERAQRYPAWVSAYGRTLHSGGIPSHYMAVISRCETSSELRFVLPILKARRWRAGAQNRLISDGFEIRIQENAAEAVFDFVLIDRTTGRTFALDVVSPLDTSKSPLQRVQHRGAAEALKWHYEQIPAIDAAMKGQFWSGLLLESAPHATNAPAVTWPQG
ncbi:MAG: hypothetical protein V4550_04070 [Gemmatimonadota bacterium]